MIRVMEGQAPPTVAQNALKGKQLDPEKLLSLYWAYASCYLLIVSTCNLFLWTHILTYPLMEGSVDGWVWLMEIACIGMTVVINIAFCYPFAKMVAIGRGRDGSYAFGVALLATVLSPLVFGLGAVTVIQMNACKGMKEYGITSGLMGVKKADVEAKVAELRRTQQVPPPTTV